MGALVWLVIPAVAVVAAAVWGRWAGRRRITGDGASLAGYERFRVAMEKAPPGTGGEPAATGQQAEPAPEPAAAQDPAPAPATADAQLTARIDARLAAGAAGPDEEGSPTGPIAGSVP